MPIALYPGTFDPVTNGHVDIAMRASSLFERLIVAVLDASPKRLLFNTEERVDLFKQAVAEVPNIEVVAYAGLTVQYAKERNAGVIVRGLRASSDFEYEFDMAMMNRKLDPDIDVICMMSRLEYQFLSASLLKEVCALGGHVSSLVPKHVEAALKEKMRGRRPQEE